MFCFESVVDDSMWNQNSVSIKSFKEKIRKWEPISCNCKLCQSYIHNLGYVNRRTTRGEGGRPPLPFFENQKKWPDFGKKCPDCVHLYAKFAIQNAVLRTSKRKTSKKFPCEVFFLDFLIKCLSKCSNFTKPPLPWKMSGCAPGQPNLASLIIYGHVSWKQVIS